MDEKIVIKKSVYTFIVFLMGAAIFSILFHSKTYILGMILGYLLNLLTFQITINSSSLMLEIRSSRGIVTLSFLIKILIYLSGFYLSYLFSDIFDIISVFIGYLIIKITIIVIGVRH